MSWVPTAAPDSPTFEGWLANRPELLTLYRRFYATPWDDALLPPRLLELCRLRTAQLHECEAELAVRDPALVDDATLAGLALWERAEGFSEVERAALAIAEKMPWAHHAITDGEYAALRRHLDEPAVVALTVALALFDANCRLRLVFEFAPSPSTAAPAAAGPLH